MECNYDAGCGIQQDRDRLKEENDRLRLLLSECLTKFEAYGADYIHAKPTNLLRRIRAELDAAG